MAYMYSPNYLGSPAQFGVKMNNECLIDRPRLLSVRFNRHCEEKEVFALCRSYELHHTCLLPMLTYTDCTTSWWVLV